MEHWIKPGLELMGKTVQLMPLEEKHFEELIACAKDSRIWQYYARDYSSGTLMYDALHRALMLREQGNQYPFIVYHLANKKIIGSTRLMDLQHENLALEIGFTWYQPEYWRTAVNPECKLMLLNYAFEILSVGRVTIQTDALNTRSRKAIEKTGGQYEGILRSNILRDNGTRRSSAYYSIISEEWDKVKFALSLLALERAKK